MCEFAARGRFFPRRAPRAAGNLAAMRFSIGNTFAKFRGCQCEDFYPAYPWSPDRRDVVVCAKCENQAVLSELVGKRTTSASHAQSKVAIGAKAARSRRP